MVSNFGGIVWKLRAHDPQCGDYLYELATISYNKTFGIAPAEKWNKIAPDQSNEKWHETFGQDSSGQNFTWF